MELDLPEFTDSIHCKKNMIEVRGRKREIVYEHFIHIFYLCENDKCKHRTSCLYKFSDEWYFCNFCNTLMPGLPAYKVKPMSRLCKKCGGVIVNSIFSNARLEGIKK